MIIRRIASVTSLVGVGAAVLVGCGSNGDTSASQQDIENKLKKDSQFTKVLDALPAAAKSKEDVIVACFAKAIKKDANGDDVDDYVNGDKSLSDIDGDESNAKSDATNCVKSALTAK